VERPSTRPRRLGVNISWEGYRSRRLKSDGVGNGSESRRTAERTILEIRLAGRMVVMAVVRRSTAVRGAEFYQERAAARGHESHGDIRAKQKRGQQYAGQHIPSPSLTDPSLHDWRALPCQSHRHSSSAQRTHGLLTCSESEPRKATRQIAAGKSIPSPPQQHQACGSRSGQGEYWAGDKRHDPKAGRDPPRTYVCRRQNEKREGAREARGHRTS